MPATPKSPPKRMTRARAKAVEETKKAPIRSTKITTPAAKAAVASRTAKRKTRDDEDEEHAVSPASGSFPASKALTTGASAAQSKAIASTRSARTNASTTRTTTTAVAPKPTRGRPKKITPDADKPSEEDESAKAAGPARSTRTRAGSVRSGAVATKLLGSKKKVTFQESESDKENIIVVEPPKGKAPTSAAVNTGLKAKPVRRTNIKAAPVKREEKAQEKASSVETKPEPLSPMKNKQVSVPPCGDSDEQQPATAIRTPPRQLSQSPRKIQPSSLRRGPILCTIQNQSETNTDPLQADELGGSVDELQGSTAIFTSPTKAGVSLTMASPAKRPAQSPFKGSMMGSPRKVATNNGEQSSIHNDITLPSSVMSKPPKRVPMTEPRKRVIFEESKDMGFKRSLFGSPAKRPLSPIKGSTLGSNMNAPATISVTRVMALSGIQASPRRLFFSPSKQYTSALKAAKSPEASAKVHKMTSEEQARMLHDELTSAASPFSTMKKMPSSDRAYEDSQSSISPLSSRRRSRIPIKSPPRSPLQSDRNNGTVPSPSFGFQMDQGPSFDDLVASSPVAQADRGRGPQTRKEERAIEDRESEDELQLEDTTVRFSPLKGQDKSVDENSVPATPIQALGSGVGNGQVSESMTVLAERFGGWTGATPDTKILNARRIERSMFSPLHPIVDGLEDTTICTDDSYLELNLAEYGEVIAVHTDEDHTMVDLSQDDFFRQSQISEASQEYGDENAIPIDPTLIHASTTSEATCTPARIFESSRPQVIHTVSKVPLKPAADYDDSLVTKPARKTRSLSAELSPGAAWELEALRQIYPSATSGTLHTTAGPTHFIVPRKSKFAEQLEDEEDSVLDSGHLALCTPNEKTGTWSAVATPARTPRADLNPRLLSGAVVFVDVHTTEGADASGIFVELLSQMGARCVKQWHWNSRTSHGDDGEASDAEGLGSIKVGITHVVFKDGGKRTMEKVREAKGLVTCVGVGWVLDCERANKWVDEVDYAIDTSTIPRGGHRRRKSMEPKALSNMIFSPVKPAQEDSISPTKEFLNLSSSPPTRRATISSSNPDDRRVSFASVPQDEEASVPATPAQKTSSRMLESTETPPYMSGYADSTFGSPETPYFLHPQELVQKTCPPKQTQQLFFPVSGQIEDQPDESMRQKLLLARRKSLQWAPRVASPLSRAHSFK